MLSKHLCQVERYLTRLRQQVAEKEDTLTAIALEEQVQLELSAVEFPTFTRRDRARIGNR
ncbi:hypothetical protein [Coleofasciculus sp. FACHB-1120]|uniref:hypothetical protein n=1 Tax=Coleofasciculus sp. FACHB-1120 TaxID=2692783 RepID=UPI0016837BE7|nr:hypothetical protein [Coleofasciculus sp. FACHB-1120]MBD2744995.1 hypothetical protein [Coleofasciculus sp. FACHB-1120]